MLTSKNFLELFNHKVFTLAALSEKGMRSFPASPGKLDTALKYLQKENKFSEIYFMVNEGNGKLNKEETACHSTENVINFSAIFLDAELPDRDPMPGVLKFCNEFFFSPHITVKTSNQRYHYYWLIKKEPRTEESTTKWKQIQALLHSKLSSDRTMTDVPQILRVPGFTNVKKQFEITATHQDIPLYTLDDLYNHLSNHFPELATLKAFTPLQPVTDDYKVPPGERHEELLRRARRLYNLPLTDSEIKCFVDGFIQNHVTDNADFRPNGKRYPEVERILSAAKTYAEEEKLKIAQVEILKVTSNKKSKNRFELDPDFFYNAPGLVGDITRHMVDVADYPIPAHAFAAAASLVGFTKARYVQGYRKLPPLNYFICLAPAGSGKTTIQNVMKECLDKLKIRHLMEDGISSAQGLIKFLSESNGLGIICYDEVKELFQTLQNKRAMSYETRISQELTKLYTAYNSDYIPPSTKTYKGKKIVLSKPLFSFIGFGHHTLIEQLFTKDNVIEGLLPRFIILNVDERRTVNALYRPVPSRIIDQLQENVTKSCIALEEKAQSTDTPINTTPITQSVQLDHDAQPIYDAFKIQCEKYYKQCTDEQNGLEALFSRGCEQSLRLSLAMCSQAKIQPAILDFAITLVSAQMQGFYQKFNQTINETQFSKDVTRLYDKIVEMCADSKDYTVARRDIQRMTQRWFKYADDFKKQMNELAALERIIEFEGKTAAGQKQARIRIAADLD